MKPNKTTAFTVLIISITFFSTGCVTLPEPVTTGQRARQTEQANIGVQKRFQDSSTKNQSAVDSAIELAKKHSELTDQMVAMIKENDRITRQNEQLQDQIAILKPELERAKTELGEANDLLINMRIELNEWKTNILGFRDEMREADQAQLGALMKILTFLGGESTEATTGQPQ